MRLTKYEKETIILMNAGDKEATVYTADRAVMRRLDVLAENYPESYRIIYRMKSAGVVSFTED